MTDSSEITDLMNDAARGNREAGERLWTRVYDELKRIAHRELAREGAADTLSTTGLVHEAYFKLGGTTTLAVHSRRHFYGLACRAMRQVLVDHARRRRAEKRGGGAVTIPLDEAEPATPTAPDRGADLVELDDALTRLAGINERLVRVVECRFFGGLSFPEIAETLEIPLRTAERDWQRARTYLYRMLGPVDGSGTGGPA